MFNGDDWLNAPLMDVTQGLFEVVNEARGVLAGCTHEVIERFASALERIALRCDSLEGSAQIERHKRRHPALTKLTAAQREAINVLRLTAKGKKDEAIRCYARLKDLRTRPYVEKARDYGIHQSKTASGPRGKIGEGEETISGIVRRLASSPKHRDLLAKQLWNIFISELDGLGLNPTEAGNGEGLLVTFDHDSDRKQYKLSTFKKTVSNSRVKHKKKIP